ncbi:MAG TPA: molybdopterin-binding protein [Pseudolabrys sp.]|jgi:molybdopterin biosynthesis enzyme|nr:molybdopterin-binding protein [Pseudolabrys sp.]
MASHHPQAIARLTPLGEALGAVEAQVKPVAPGRGPPAAGRVLAEDVAAPRRPEAAIALADGWAISADDTLGAGGTSPTALPRAPARIDAGQPMPPGADSVAPLDAVQVTAAGAQALAAVFPGDGVLPVGGDAHVGEVLRRAGERLRLADVATFTALGLPSLALRIPRVRLVPLRDEPLIAAAAQLIGADLERRGALLRESGSLDNALNAADADMIVGIGGTGTGRNDSSVAALRRDGRLVLHGLALSPGETAAFGFAGDKPVLLLPGRLDAALAVWLTLGRLAADRLSGAKPVAEFVDTARLTRKIASTVGITEFVPVTRDGRGAEPLASRYLPLSALSRADGYVLVPAESEGYSAGAAVRVWPWP